MKESRLISNDNCCSGSSFTASKIVRLGTAKLPSPSHSSRFKHVCITFSLSDAVIFNWLLRTSKRKQSRIGNEFLLLITLANACKRLLSAVLDKVNLISILFFSYCSSVLLGTKIQKSIV